LPTALQLSSTTANPTTYASSGVQVAFTFTVVNQGSASVTGLQIVNTWKNIGPISCSSTTLLAGAQTTCSAIYTTTLSDVLANRLLVGNVFASALSSTSSPSSSSSSAAAPIVTTTVYSNTFVHLMPYLAATSQQHSSNFTASSPLAMLGIVGFAAFSIGGVWLYRNNKINAVSSAVSKLFGSFGRTRAKNRRARTIMTTTTSKQRMKNVSFGGDIEESTVPLHDAITAPAAAQQQTKAPKTKIQAPSSTFFSRSTRAAQALEQAKQSLVGGERERRAAE